MDPVIRKINILKGKRSRIQAKLSVTSELIPFLNIQAKRQIFTARLEKLEEFYNDFKTIQDDLQDLLSEFQSDENIDDLNNAESCFDELYYNIKAASKVLDVQEAKRIDSPVLRSQVSAIRPPPITLPKFDGKIEDWSQFYSMFKSMIHNNDTFTSIEKYHYLLSCLNGSALSLIKSFPIIDENYEIVWNTLTQHYQNSRVLFCHYSDQLLGIKPISFESVQAVSKFIANFQDNLSALQAFQKQEIFELFIAHIIIRNLDHTTKRQFEAQLKGEEIPTASEVLDFLHNHLRVLQMSNPLPRPTLNKSSSSSSTNAQYKRAFVATNNNTTKTCKLCNSDQHHIMKCSEFLNYADVKRMEVIKQLKLCFNCLKSHQIKNCTSKFSCLKCGKRHNTLLHKNERQSCSTPSTSNEVLMTTPSSHVALLGTASAACKDSSGVYKPIRLLIDTGSQVSIMSERCANRLGLQIKAYSGGIKGIGQYPVTIKGEVRCCFKPKTKSGPLIKSKAIVISNISSEMHSSKLCLDLSSMNISREELADDNFDTPGEIDFLLGATLFPSILDGGRTTSGNSNISVLSTIFGLVLIGDIPNTQTTYSSLHISLDESIKRFWTIEEPPCKHISNPDDDKCEEIFVSKHYRQSDGRYVVPLTLITENLDLNSFYNMAFNRLQNIERKLSQTPAIYDDYKFFMNEYESLGHMEKINSENDLSSFCFIPHHCVLKPDSVSTKLRVVFDASAKNIQGKSLNQYLLPGTKLQNDIAALILNFRIFPFVFTADICKMYRQILVLPEHRKYQHILWRSSSEQPVCNYELKTVTYGLSCAPFQAIRTLHQLAKDEGSLFPRAAQVLMNDIYVDDVLTGAYSKEDAMTLRIELVDLLNAGKFSLSKWASNHLDILPDIPNNYSNEAFLFEKEAINVLGLKWNPNSDTFFYEIGIVSNKCTKREILSRIAQIFDPLGWIAPVVFRAKCLIQTLWRQKVDWDSPVPATVAAEWHAIAENLSLLSGVHIPRYLGTTENTPCTLVGFSDASEHGYAAVVYIVVHSIIPKVHLLIAKSKVAPLKTLTIPRLELLGALLLSKIMHYIRSSFKSSVNIHNVFLFTDSTIVLSWLRTPPYLLKIFVANRIIQIQENDKISSWRHVGSRDNPADCASRGLSPEQLSDHPLWFSGPKWLLLPTNEWPSHTPDLIKLEELPETKSTVQVNIASKCETSINIAKYSSWTQLRRVVAWMLRFIHNCRCEKALRRRGCLQLREVGTATNIIIKIDQEEHFNQEISSISRGSNCSRQLQKLCPFIDNLGILRVGGRLEKSNLRDDRKHPVVLSKNSQLTNLLIDYYHKSYLHAGPRLLQFLIQKQFWIFSVRCRIKSRLAKCLVCAKLKAYSVNPLMGNLPTARITPSRPFSCVGIDFGGPFLLKEHKRRGAKFTKAYICLFVCMSTKAVHLEVVSDLSTEAFVASLDRFVSRRGLCAHIYTDCGSNFLGAKRYFAGLFKFMETCSRDDDFIHNLNDRGISWHFNPPSAPHFGGLWEAGIRSVKYHTKRVMGDTALTFEEFATLLSKIEAMLNSRPLCSISNDPNDIDALTPGHFLIGDALLSLPEWDASDAKVNRLNRWQHLQQMSQHFWQRWSLEYLQTLQQREKWFTSHTNIKIGDLVILKDPRLPPSKWSLGRITTVNPGTDGVVRVVSVKTKAGTYLRPVTKVCPLPNT